MGQNEIIRMEHIHKAFSGVDVIKDVNLTLYSGEVLGLVGENGAGKSTLMNLLTGVYPTDKGAVWYKGKEFSPKNALAAQIAGISFIHQELDLFENLSVLENMFIERIPTRGGVFNDRTKMRKIGQKAIDRIGGGLDLNAIVGEMEMGKRQMLEIVKAISKDASVIIFDEPTTSLSAEEKERLFDIINDLRNDGISIIYISHNLDEIFRLSNRIMVMRNGERVAVLENKNITREKLIKLMIGREVANIYPYYIREIGSAALEVRHICSGKKLMDISFTAHHGEVLGIFGLMGAGRSELMRGIFGVDKIDGGEVVINGRRLYRLSPGDCIANGMAFLTENRSHEGLLLDKTVEENLVVTNLKELAGQFSLLDKKREHEMRDEMVSKLNIKTYDASRQTARKLSGGNQQKIVIGKWLLKNPAVFLMDEPTRGIDVGAKAEVYELINRLACDGNCIIMVSSEMEELMGVCDRILVMHTGKISGCLDRADFNREKLLQLAFGIQEGER